MSEGSGRERKAEPCEWEKDVAKRGSLEEALLKAALDGDERRARDLLWRGAFADARCEQGETALMKAALGDSAKVAEELLLAGAEAARLLLEAGADWRAKDAVGVTAEKIAETHRSPETLELLRGRRVAAEESEGLEEAAGPAREAKARRGM